MDSPINNKTVLVHSIIQFLQEELRLSEHSEEKKESIEVAIQCLETAYDTSNMKEPSFDLLSIVSSSSVQKKEVTDQAKTEAEKFKTLGNDAIKNDQYLDALDNYSKAIDLNPYNAVYYCNRAAVYSKLGRHMDAVEDCQEAIKLDPSYGKAYSRLGIAYSHLNRLEEARNAYKTALQYDPNNTMYENNLKLAEDRLTQGSGSSASQPSIDASFLNNPTLLGMASQMLHDPAFRNVLSGLMTVNPIDNSNMEMLFQAGHTLANRMNEVDPSFLENLRRSMNQQPGSQDDSNINDGGDKSSGPDGGQNS